MELNENYKIESKNKNISTGSCVKPMPSAEGRGKTHLTRMGGVEPGLVNASGRPWMKFPRSGPAQTPSQRCFIEES